MLYKRIVAKFGTNLLTARTDSLSIQIMSNLTQQIARLHSEGHEIVIVSSGAVAAGRQKLNLSRDSKDVPFKQVLASLGQSQLMYTYEQLFSKHKINIAQALLTRNDLINRAGYLNTRNTLLALIELGIICIINENDVVATEELVGAGFGDNDNLSALVASLVDADLLILLTDIEGLYTANPVTNNKARLIPEVTTIDSRIQRLARGTNNKLGTGGMITKIKAAQIATSSGITMVIASGFQADSLYQIAQGSAIGTSFPPCTSKMESKKRWMLSGLASKGKILIDDGAVKALKMQNKSLLPAGIINLEGKFQRGDVVEIYHVNGTRIACGITNYNNKEIAAIKGLHSSEIEGVLGYELGSEVVHRNNMVLLYET